MVSLPFDRLRVSVNQEVAHGELAEPQAQGEREDRGQKSVVRRI